MMTPVKGCDDANETERCGFAWQRAQSVTSNADRADGQGDQASSAEGLKRCVKGGARGEESVGGDWMNAVTEVLGLGGSEGKRQPFGGGEETLWRQKTTAFDGINAVVLRQVRGSFNPSVRTFPCAMQGLKARDRQG